MPKQQYQSLYRAIVTNLKDPEKSGRIKVKIPSVLGEGESAWCEPCFPFSIDNGGDFYLPVLGDTVWVSFEEGNLSNPVWLGNWVTPESSPLADYSKATNLRVISFFDVILTMDKTAKSLTISCDGNELKLDKTNIDKLKYLLDNKNTIETLVNNASAIITHINS
jgi:hypothetical protein